jgi:hypothetical protein
VPHRGPTQFPELNELLHELSERTAEILGGNFVGAYLQGSFAVGDADLQSDCDFLIPVHGPITPDQEAGLRTLHDELPTRPGHWTITSKAPIPTRTSCARCRVSAGRGCTSTTAGG